MMIGEVYGPLMGFTSGASGYSSRSSVRSSIPKNQKKKSKFREKVGDTGGLDDRWLWHSLTKRLVDELNYNPDQVYEMNFIASCNWLSYFKERDEAERKRLDREKGKQIF